MQNLLSRQRKGHKQPEQPVWAAANRNKPTLVPERKEECPMMTAMIELLVTGAIAVLIVVRLVQFVVNAVRAYRSK